MVKLVILGQTRHDKTSNGNVVNAVLQKIDISNTHRTTNNKVSEAMHFRLPSTSFINVNSVVIKITVQLMTGEVGEVVVRA